MSSLSSRSRRAQSSTEDDGNSYSASSSSKPLAFLTALLLSACAYLLWTWQPIDYDNIGHVRADEHLSYGPIDVVYTWVNGTDPRWKREKEFWHRHWIASLTGQPLPKQQEDAQHVKGNDVANADNRFRDNEELRYSLRSLEKYAPWIRNIYIVTDGQVPSWINLEATNLHIVKHAEIFANKSHLPVFSSPAIEWNLDNIPGLSDNFLYFNDDVFLGAKVHPEDFVSARGVQKVYFAWEVPLCSAGCWDNWLANDRCDLQCNVTACDFDMGDCGCDVNPNDGAASCDPVKIATIQETTPKPPKLQDTICHGGCHYAWIGDKGCDPSCNVTTCGFDGGDCGRDMYEHQLPIGEITANHTLVQVPLAVESTYLNLRSFFGLNGSVTTATHDNGELIRHATLFEEEFTLLLVFGRDQEGDPMTSSALVTVLGRDANDTELRLDFELVRGNKAIENTTSGSGFATFTNMSIRPRQVRLPLAFRQSTWTAVDKPLAVVTSEGEANREERPITPTLEDPFVEILLPVNVTGKQFKIGEIMTLAIDSKFRLHSDDDSADLLWTDSLLCELVVPDLKKLKKVTEEVTVTVDAMAGDTTAEAPISEAPVQENAVDSNGVPKCHVLEDGQIRISLRLPTHKNVNQFREDESGSTNDATGPTPSRGDDGSTPSNTEAEPVPSEAMTKEEDTAAIAEKEVEADRSQVADGHVCFYNADNKNKQYCFAVSIGHFQTHRVTVALKPKPVLTPAQKEHAERLKPVPYEPYDGVENPTWQEFATHCMDTTRRLIGLRPRKCYLSEIPAIIEQKDPTTTNAENGRRLACEAKRRRLNEMEDRLAQEAQDRRTRGGFRLLVSDLVSSTTSRLNSLLGFETVEATNEDIEDVEYEDVCKPLFEADREAAANAISAANAEALLSKDTFGDSLKFVNRLYNRAFGKAKERRRVPSHMPFLLNRNIIREIKARWPNEFEATSTHRFRHPQDMQFSFSYFHYLINRHKVQPPSLEFIWHEYLDANRNGILDENEVLTVASLAYGDYPTDAFLEEVRLCLRPPKQEKVMEKSTAMGTVLVAETLTPHITMDHLKSCTNVTQSLIKNVRKEKRHELMPEDEVTFHMLSDQYQYAWNQMLGTRARRTKFVCINDDMKFPSPSVAQILHELFLSIWPKRSQFELPYHLKNRYDHIDDYVAAKDRRDMYLYVALTVLLLLVAIFWSELRKLFGFQDIARARAESASQLSAQLEEEEDASHQTRSGRRYHAMASPPPPSFGGGGSEKDDADEDLAARRQRQQQEWQAQAVRVAREERLREARLQKEQRVADGGGTKMDEEEPTTPRPRDAEATDVPPEDRQTTVL